MSFLSNALKNEEENDLVGYKNQRKLVRRLPQVKVKHNLVIDATRNAMPSGKRISKNGKTYWETRSNRTDAKGSSI